MKKLFAILLAAVLALSVLTACGEDEKAPAGNSNQTTTVALTQDTLVGTWHMDWTMTDSSSLISALADASETPMPESMINAIINGVKSKLSMDMQFNADGTLVTTMSKDSFIKMYDEMCNAMIDYIVNGNGLDDILAAQGVDKAQYEAQLAAQGMTMDQLKQQFDTTYRQILNGQTMFNNIREAGKMTLDENGNIVQTQTYSFSGNAIIFHHASGAFFTSNGGNMTAEFTYDGKTIRFTDSNDLVVYDQTMTKVG